jgi:hypothetical protein
MSALSHWLEQAHNSHAASWQLDLPLEVASAKEFRIPADDGLGCMRGLGVAMLCNILLVLVIASGWVLWNSLH